MSHEFTMSRFRLNWSDLLDPWCYWIYPHGLERALLAMGYLVRTGYQHQADHAYGPLDCLYGTGTRGMTSSPVVNSLESLRTKFGRAILDRHTRGLDEWREKWNIGYDKTATIPGKHYEPMHAPDALFSCEADAQKQFDRLLKTADVKLNVGLNKYHSKGARWVHRVFCKFDRQGTVSFVMGYGYRRESIEWDHVLASQNKGEPPFATLHRAIDALSALTMQLAVGSEVRS